jgi:hypothetical protein
VPLSFANPGCQLHTQGVGDRFRAQRVKSALARVQGVSLTENRCKVCALFARAIPHLERSLAKAEGAVQRGARVIAGRAALVAAAFWRC